MFWIFTITTENSKLIMAQCPPIKREKLIKKLIKKQQKKTKKQNNGQSMNVGKMRSSEKIVG